MLRADDAAAPAPAAARARRTVRVLTLIDHLVLGGAQMLLAQFAAQAPRAAIEMEVSYLVDLEDDPAGAPLAAAGIAARGLHFRIGPGPRMLLAVRRHVAEIAPDLVHTHLGTSDMVGGVAARSLGIPVISTVHSIPQENDYETRVKHAIVKAFANRIVAVSDSAARAYLERGWARRRQLVTIRNGIDVSAEPGAGREVRRELGLAPDDLVVGMISSLRREKAHDVAVEAVRILRSRFPSLRLLIVGHGPEMAQIARASADLGDAVVMPGLRYDVMRCFDACDLCLHPSRMDAFPTTLIEAMAASVAVLATDVGGIPEIVVDGETGVLLAPPPSADRVAAALAPLLEDPLRRRALGRAGRAVYEQRFSARQWVEQTRALYDEVLEGRPRRG